MYRFFIFTGILFLFTMSLAGKAFAFSPTQFGSCLNPQVSAAQVNVGTNHGVVGYPGVSFLGTDSIYSLDNNNVLQCLCTDSGEGYQTTWLRSSNYSSSEVSTLRGEEWLYFADAGLWGLEGSYLAKTVTYFCNKATPTPTLSCTPTPSVSETPTPTPAGSITPTATPGATNTPTPGPTATPTPGKPVITTLASTGNAVFVYMLVGAGLLSLLIGIALRKFGK